MLYPGLSRCLLYHTLLRMGIPGTPFSAGGEVKKAGASRPRRLDLVLGVAVLIFSEIFRDNCAFPNCLVVNPVIIPQAPSRAVEFSEFIPSIFILDHGPAWTVPLAHMCFSEHYRLKHALGYTVKFRRLFCQVSSLNSTLYAVNYGPRLSSRAACVLSHRDPFECHSRRHIYHRMIRSAAWPACHTRLVPARPHWLTTSGSERPPRQCRS